MTRNEALATTNYTLNKGDRKPQAFPLGTALKRLLPLLAGEQRVVVPAFLGGLVSTASILLGPIIIGRTVDTYILNGNFGGVLTNGAILLLIYLCGLFASYFQTLAMGTVGRTVLFKLRNALFTKLQELPLVFFTQNKSGDLISRINNDTDKLNQFFSQSLVQMMGNVFIMTGAAIFLLVLNVRLGAVALFPAIAVLILTASISGWVKKKNVASLQALGSMSGEIQESLSNFKVIVAFNRLDYFRRKFNEANERNYSASLANGIVNGVLFPVYGLALHAAQLVVLAYGLYLVAGGSLTVGVLIGFVLYVNSLYQPLRQLAVLWATLQQALAAVERISEVLKLESDMPVIAQASGPTVRTDAVLEFEHVRFRYPGGNEDVLRNVTFTLQRGKTYALVGPTGGGKTTTAFLMARLYDPADGRVLLAGRDIRSYPAEERTQRIGFILQEPLLFTGTIRDNVLYGNEKYKGYSDEKLVQLLNERNVGALLSRFEQGLETKVSSSADAISLGQKQIVAFMRAVLRDPEVLILDEATANIDTVTEQQLGQILDKLPASTTKVIIAHRLNTIANADEIFFINSGEITPAGSMQHALDMLMHGKRSS